MSKNFMLWAQIVKICLAAIIAINSQTSMVFAEIAPRDIRIWYSPTDADVAITFSTPEDYVDCPADGTLDVIEARGIPAGWHLKGSVWLTYFDGDDRIDVPSGKYPIDFTSLHADSTFSLQMLYPSTEQWAKNRYYVDRRDLHVDLAIEVTSEFSETVRWIGGDLLKAPGTLGPGGQDWTITCIGSAQSSLIPLFLPQISQH